MSITEERPAVLVSDRERTILAMAVARTWRDEEYKARLMADPRATLAAEGLEFPAHAEVRAVTGAAVALHDTSDVVHVIVPDAPDGIGPAMSGPEGLARAADAQTRARADQPVNGERSTVYAYTNFVIGTEVAVGAEVAIVVT